ncbi:MAG TPA: hypothetical protein PKD90_09490, partial [Phnomibacter sp.]|nr:hypothetical protein [Phnomibacter sp.]
MESDKKESIIQGFPWLQGSRVKYLLWFIAAAWVYSLSFIIQNYWAKYASYPSITRQYQQQLKGSHRTFEGLLANEDLLKRIAFGTTTEADNYYLQNLPFKLFLYQSPRKADRLIYWSSNTVLPPEWMVDNGVSGTVFKYGNGQYEIIRKPITINGLPFTAIALVPLYQQFFIENARLHKGFPGFKGMENRMEYSEKATPYPINGIANEPLFYLKPVSDQPFTVFSWSGMVVQILAALLVFLGISHIAAQYFKYRLVIQGLLVFGLSFMGLWILVKKFGIPINIGQLGQLQGYDALARPPDNLLSLVQNGVFGIWLALFLTFHSTVIIQYIQKASRLWLRMLATLLALGMVMLHYVLIVFISRLYLNTAIAFDLNNFFSLDYTTVLAFVLLFALAIMHLLLTRFAVRTMVVLLVGGVWVMVGVVAVMGLFVLSTPLFQEFKLELLFSLVWLLLFALYIGSTRHPAFPVTSGRLVLWLFVYAFSIGLLLGGLSAKRLRQRVYDVGQNLLMQNDRTSEYLVRIAAAGARRLPWPSLIKQAADSVRCRQIADSVRNRFFGEYLARYQTEVYLYNQNKEPLGGTSTPGFETLNTLFERQAIQSDIPWLSYFEEAYDRFGYLIKFEVTEPGNATPAGTVFIVTRYVLLRNTLLAPELFKQIQDFAVDLPPGLSYAWYRKGTLVEQYRNYPFYAGLPEEINGQQSFWENQTETAIEIWFNASKDTVLAVAGARRLMIGLVSMVAYIFCAFLVMFILI